jgi:hypothetical protein
VANLPHVSKIQATNLPHVSTIPATNLPPVAGGIDTGGKQCEQLSNWGQLKMNLKKKFIYMLTLLPKGVQKKSEKKFSD